MKFHIYGRHQLEIRLENGGWEIYREAETGIDPYIPSDLETEDSATYLDDIYYELAGSGYESVLLS